jgi:hypothetical protein
MFRQPSHLVARRGIRGLPTIPSAIALLVMAAVALGACSIPASNAAEKQQPAGGLQDTFDRAALGGTATTTSPALQDTFDRAALGGSATTTSPALQDTFDRAALGGPARR